MNKQLIEKILKFRDERNWKQFHTPENLAKSICIEAAELLENFQWNSNEINLDEIKSEVADIFIYLILFTKTMKIDSDEVIKKKLIKNKKRYPIELSKGNSKKYSKLKS